MAINLIISPPAYILFIIIAHKKQKSLPPQKKWAQNLQFKRKALPLQPQIRMVP